MTEQKKTMVLPEGAFCGNCIDCRYADLDDQDSNGRIYCGCPRGFVKGYQYPKDRHNCDWYDQIKG